jgi:uncharacterized caspase-like protein
MTEKRNALIIGSYLYQDPELRRLVAPARDAEALSQVLADPSIGRFETQMLLNEPSHKVNQAIEAFFADRKREDLILLYFSGHGIKDEEGRLYFATTDTSRQMLRTTAIPATLVHDVMRYSRSKRQVLLLDCCYSGAFGKRDHHCPQPTSGSQTPFHKRAVVGNSDCDTSDTAGNSSNVRRASRRYLFVMRLIAAR